MNMSKEHYTSDDEIIKITENLVSKLLQYPLYIRRTTVKWVGNNCTVYVLIPLAKNLTDDVCRNIANEFNKNFHTIKYQKYRSEQIDIAICMDSY